LTGGRAEAGRVAVRRAATGDLPTCFDIRRRVFIEGQGVPDEIEIDGRDEAATHFLATRDGVPIATARLREYEGAAKVERVAVLGEHRGGGVGRAVMEALEEDARSRGFSRAVLHAQVAVAEFYERLGYAREGPTFLEAEIPHVRMAKAL
jgi:predicted GNAT family N-acyltransferase